MPRAATDQIHVAPPPPRSTKRGGVQKPRKLQIDEARSRGRDTSTNAAARLVSPDKPLTESQKAFARAYAQGESVVTAMTRAGYGASTGSVYGYRLIHQPNVAALIAEEKRKYEEACQMTRKRVMDGLLEGIEMAKLAGEPASMISGWREIGKMCGYYEPTTRKVEVSVTGNIVHDRLNRLSDAELLQVIQGGALQALEAPEDDDE